MAMSLLASTMSMFESTVRKNGQSSCIACSIAIPFPDCVVVHALTAAPNPNQPGSISRHCAQVLDALAARARRRTAADIEAGDLLQHRGFAEIPVEAFGLVDQIAIGTEGMRRQFFHDREIVAGWRRAVPFEQRRLERGRSQGFEIAPADFRVGILAGDYFALLGDADLALHG